MRKAISCLIFMLIAVPLLSGCLFDDASTVTVVSMGPKPLEYHPGRYGQLNVTLDANEYFDNVTVNLTGLKNSVGQLKLYESKLVDLEKGSNNVSFRFYVPSCSSCNKLNPGPYNMTVTVTREGSVLCEHITTAYLLE